MAQRLGLALNFVVSPSDSRPQLALAIRQIARAEPCLAKPVAQSLQLALLGGVLLAEYLRFSLGATELGRHRPGRRGGRLHGHRQIPHFFLIRGDRGFGLFLGGLERAEAGNVALRVLQTLKLGTVGPERFGGLIASLSDMTHGRCDAVDCRHQYFQP